jgi:hypothetical protein
MLNKVSYPNPNHIDDDTLGDQLTAALKKFTTFKVDIGYEIENGIHHVIVYDKNIDIIKIEIKYRTIGLELLTETSTHYDVEAVNQIYKVVRDLFRIWFL